MVDYIGKGYIGNDEINIYLVEFPTTAIHEMITPCPGGYTVYLDARQSSMEREKAYRHAIRHVLNDDFAEGNVDGIEAKAHN